MARGTGAGDPRRETGGAVETSVRPMVAASGREAPTLLIAAGAIGAGLALFLLLDSHRRALEVPAVRIGAADRTVAAGAPQPPPLYLPPAPVERVVVPVDTPPPAPAPAPPVPTPRIVYVPQPSPPVQPVAPAVVPPRDAGASALVIDNTVGDGNPGVTPGGSGTSTGGGNANATITGATTAAPGARARATMLADRTTTVVQGTLIPAVLETAFDSTRPGLARAVVSRDVRGFDGSRVLIPRGSKLTGEYRSDVASGQNRALIVWTRLVRPDGAAIALASPVADTLGRGGVKGHVNTHFFARFTGAILQTALAVGVNLASRPSTGTVVLGQPGSTVGSGINLGQNQVVNTLTVRAGTSIGVLVSRDLDFADVEGRR